MTRLRRAHAAAAVACLALVPAVPLGLWIYARVASVDRGAAIAANMRAVHRLKPLPGFRYVGAEHYSQRAWDGENLVPISSYRTEAFWAVPAGLSPDAVVAEYDRQLRGWRRTVRRVSCSTVGERPGCGARWVTYRRGHVKIELDATMLALGKQSELGLYVSQ